MRIVSSIHSQRSGYPDPAGGRIHAQVNVLDVLEHHVYCDITELDLRGHQYSFCALMMRKIRSTSATSCRMSYRACLITRSRGSTPRQSSGRTLLYCFIDLQCQVKNLIAWDYVFATFFCQILRTFSRGFAGCCRAPLVQGLSSALQGYRQHVRLPPSLPGRQSVLNTLHTRWPWPSWRR